MQGDERAQLRRKRRRECKMKSNEPATIGGRLYGGVGGLVFGANAEEPFDDERRMARSRVGEDANDARRIVAEKKVLEDGDYGRAHALQFGCVVNVCLQSTRSHVCSSRTARNLPRLARRCAALS